MIYARRMSEYAAELARKESNPKRKAELQMISQINAKVPAHKPTTFWEAIQSVWTVESLLVVEENQKILGFARYLTDEVMTTFLAEIIIDKAYRGKGLGRRLIAEIHQKHPLTRIELISEADGFYQTVGFKPVGTGLRKSI